MADGHALAEEALALLGRQPRAGLALADQAVSRSRAEKDAGAVSLAHRAAGLALRELGDSRGAERRLRSAVRAARTGGDAQCAAEAEMSLAFVLLDQGRCRAALAATDRAAAPLRGKAAARLAGQRALVLQRCGKTEEALAAYARALPVLVRAGDALWEARLRNNRGLLHAYRGAFAASERELRRARALYQDLGQDVYAIDAAWNLGFVAALRGDVPEALSRYDEAEQAAGRLPSPRPEFLVDRCELLIAAGLFQEARITAVRAVRALEAAGRDSTAAEARLQFAQASYAAGLPVEAVGAARSAADTFRRQNRPSWTLLARYVELRAELASGDDQGAVAARAVRTADALAAAGWRVHALDLRLHAAQAALLAGRHSAARVQLSRAAAAKRGGPLPLQTRAWHAEALLRLADGNERGADGALRTGLAILERGRALLGASELRAHVASHGAELVGLGLRQSLSSGDGARVLDWAERGRAGALRHRPARPPAPLAQALAEVRLAVQEVETARLSGADPARAESRLRRLERRVVSLTRKTGAEDAVPASSSANCLDLAALGDRLGDRILVEYVLSEYVLAAVVLRRGVATLHELGPVGPVLRAAESVTFALRRLTAGFGSARGLAAAAAGLNGRAADLDGLLLGPLLAADAPLVVVPTGALAEVPWSLLPSCRGRAVSVAPSAAVWLRSMVARERPRPDRRVVLVAGPGLPAAVREVDAIRPLWPEATTFTGSHAASESVLPALDGVAYAHIAAHGQLRRDNPLFSSLQLADGPLTVYDLERLHVPPAVALLPACRSGVGTHTAAGEVLGLAASLLGLGSASIVATLVAVPDAATCELTVALHRRLAQGASPATALAEVQQEASDSGEPATAATAAAFVAFGA